jgi:tetratricopeptide (TPR) repeat protein
MILQIVTRWMGCIALCICGVTSVSFAAEQEALNDLSARIQFEYYSADVRAMQRDLQALEKLKASGPEEIMRLYNLAYGHMKLAELLTARDRSAARKSASECTRYAEEVTDQEPKRVSAGERARLDTLYGEFWAIQAACISLEAEMSRLPVPALADNRARNKASALAPGNPRVRLLAAIQSAKDADTAQERNAASRSLIEVSTMFDTAPPAANGMPDWGHAEALAWLGQSYLQLGDNVAARDALERALVLAPDFAWARTLLTQLKSSR